MTILKVPDQASFVPVLMVFLLAWLLSGCTGPTSNPIATSLTGSVQHDFPEFFLEKGSDMDSSYISFRGEHFRNDTLQLEMTSWGVVEYGLFLRRQNDPQSASFFLMGKCGTVPTRTWRKVRLTHYLGAIERDTLWSLSFSNLRDTLTIRRTEITLGEK